MLNTIKMEGFSIKRSKAFRVLLLASVGISIAFVIYFAIVVEENGKNSLIGALWDTSIMIVLSAILSSLYIGSDFHNRMVGVQVATGHSRLEILMSKSIIFALASIPLVLAYPALRTIICTLLYGWGEAFTGGDVIFIVRAVSLSVFLNIANSTIYILFAFLFQDTGKTVACSLLFYPIFSTAFSLLGSNIRFLQTFYEHTPQYFSQLVVAPTISSADIFSSILSGIVMIVLVLGITFLLFRRRELK